MSESKFFLKRAVIFLWFFGFFRGECTKKDKVYCEIMNDSRPVYVLIDTSWALKEAAHREARPYDGLKTNVNVHIVNCYLYKSSTFTYNMIGRNISDSYIFEDLNDTLISPEYFYDSHDRDNNTSVEYIEISLETGYLQLLPNGFDLVFPKISSLNITNCELAIIDKENMRQFGDHLKAANFSRNQLTFLTEDIFEYNQYLEYCDFSGNPLAHIPDAFLHYIVYIIESNLRSRLFDFNSVECTGEESVSVISNDPSPFVEGVTVLTLKYNPINCTNPDRIVNYTDLEYHLRIRPPEKRRLFCKSFNNNHSSKIATTYCNLTVSNPRTIVEASEYFKYYNINSTNTSLFYHQANMSATRFHLYIIGSQIEYIPRKLSETVEKYNGNIKLEYLIITRSKLRSINVYDMKQFGDSLTFADFSSNLLKSIAKNVFKHNRRLKEVKLTGNPIIYISASYYSLYVENGGQKNPCGKFL